METPARITDERNTTNTPQTSKPTKPEEEEAKESSLKKRKTTTEESLKGVCVELGITQFCTYKFFRVTPTKN